MDAGTKKQDIVSPCERWKMLATICKQGHLFPITIVGVVYSVLWRPTQQMKYKEAKGLNLILLTLFHPQFASIFSMWHSEDFTVVVLGECNWELYDFLPVKREWWLDHVWNRVAFRCSYPGISRLVAPRPVGGICGPNKIHGVLLFCVYRDELVENTLLVFVEWLLFVGSHEQVISPWYIQQLPCILMLSKVRPSF